MRAFSTGLFIGALGAALAVHAANGMSQSSDTSAVYKAPFNILGASGESILTVEETSNGPQMTIRGAEGRSVRIGGVQSGDGMAVAVYAGDERHASLLANSDGLVINIVSGTRSVALIDTPDNRGLQIADDEVKSVDLGIRAGKNAVLRISSPAGAEVVSIGSSQVYGGSGAVFVKDPSGKTSGFMVAQADGSGQMGILIGGNEVAKLEPNKDSSGGKVTLADASGTVAATMGSTVGGGGAVCLFGKTRSKCDQPK